MQIYKIISFVAAVVVSISVCACEEREGNVNDNHIYKDRATVKSTVIQTDGPIEPPHPVSLTVIIDAGHGFDDGGSQPPLLEGGEAEVTLRAALALKEKLTDAGIGVVLTHDGAHFPSVSDICYGADNFGVEYDVSKMVDNNIFSPYERVIYGNVLASQLRNCIFISLHTNSYEDPSVGGLSIDYHAGNPNRESLAVFSRLFKETVASELGKETVIFEDSYDEAFIVTKYNSIPSVLIEMGYGTNRQDANDLMSDEWIDSFCTVLTECVVKHFKEGGEAR